MPDPADAVETAGPRGPDALDAILSRLGREVQGLDAPREWILNPTRPTRPSLN